jgi:WD40 repeat protein
VVAIGNADRARRNEARAEEQASIATSRQLAAEARTHLEDDLDLALLLAVTSHEERPTVESRSILVDALGTAPQMVRYAHGEGEPLLDVAPGLEAGQQLVVDAAGNARRWDQNLGSAVELDHGLDLAEPGRAGRVVVRPHHDEVVAARADGLSLWSAADGQWRPLAWAPPLLAEGALGFSDDGQLLAVTRDDGRVAILDLDAEDASTLEGEIDDPTGLSTFGLSFSPDERWLAATFGDGGLAVADLGDGEVTVLPQQYGHTEHVAFSPDSRSLAFAAAGGQVKVLDLPTLDESVLRPADPDVTEFTGLLSDVFPVVFSPDGSEVLVGGPDGVVHRWSVPAATSDTGTPSTQLPLSRSGISELAFADASTLLVADQSGTIERWDLDRPESFGSPLGPVAEAQAVTVSPSGDLVAVGGCDPSAVSDLGEGGVGCSDGIIVVAPTSGEPATTIHAHDDFVDALTFTADGSAIISGGRDGRIVRVELGDGFPRTLTEPGGSVTDIALSPDGTAVASSNFNGAVFLTSVDSGRTEMLRPERDMGGSDGFEWPISVAFTPDGTMLFAGSTHGGLMRWTLPSAGADELDPSPDGEITDLAVSADGSTLAVLTGGAVRRLDIASGTWSDEPPIEGAFGGMAFAPDGTQLAYGSPEGLAVRDLSSGQLVGEPWRPAASPYGAVARGGPADDPVLAITDANGATWWRAGDERLVFAACERANRVLDPAERSRFLLAPSSTTDACAR